MNITIFDTQIIWQVPAIVGSVSGIVLILLINFLEKPSVNNDDTYAYDDLGPTLVFICGICAVITAASITALEGMFFQVLSKTIPYSSIFLILIGGTTFWFVLRHNIESDISENKGCPAFAYWLMLGAQGGLATVVGYFWMIAQFYAMQSVLTLEELTPFIFVVLALTGISGMTAPFNHTLAKVASYATFVLAVVGGAFIALTLNQILDRNTFLAVAAASVVVIFFLVNKKKFFGH